MTEEQVRELVRQQIIENFSKKMKQELGHEKIDVLSESELRIFARGKLREMALGNKIKDEKED
jgi:hypothetical protein